MNPKIWDRFGRECGFGCGPLETYESPNLVWNDDITLLCSLISRNYPFGDLINPNLSSKCPKASHPLFPPFPPFLSSLPRSIPPAIAEHQWRFQIWILLLFHSIPLSICYNSSSDPWAETSSRAGYTDISEAEALLWNSNSDVFIRNGIFLL